MPVNVKAMIRNRGIFNKGNILDQSDAADEKERRVKKAMTTNHHYFSHRILFAIKNGELMSKIKNFYALELF